MAGGICRSSAKISPRGSPPLPGSELPRIWWGGGHGLFCMGEDRIPKPLREDKIAELVERTDSPSWYRMAGGILDRYQAAAYRPARIRAHSRRNAHELPAWPEDAVLELFDVGLRGGSARRNEGIARLKFLPLEIAEAMVPDAGRVAITASMIRLSSSSPPQCGVTGPCLPHRGRGPTPPASPGWGFHPLSSPGSRSTRPASPPGPEHSWLRHHPEGPR